MKFTLKKKRTSKMSSFSDLFPSFLEDMDIKDDFSVETLRGVWKDIVGDIISAHSMPDRIFKGTLFIIAEHSMYSSNIMMMKKIILDKISSYFKGADIGNIKVEVKKIRWG